MPAPSSSSYGLYDNYIDSDDSTSSSSSIDPPKRDHNIPLSLLDPTLAKFAENCRMIEPTQETVDEARELLKNEDLRDRDFMSTLSYLVPEIDRDNEQPLLLNRHPVMIMQIEDGATAKVERQYDTLIDYLHLWEDNTSVHPCIAVTVVWSHISFAGFALGDSGVLTEVFSLASMNFHPQDFNTLENLARHLRALQIAINDFKDRIANGTFTLPVPLAYPYANEFFYLGTMDLTTIVYGESMCGEKLLFKGLINNSEFVCIKFTQSYGRDVHEWCEEQGWAPKLLGFEKLPNGWIMVVMEYLDKDSWVTFSDVNDKSLVVDGIQNALEKLHDNGMVHGDIEGSNIMVKLSSTEFKLIDFDRSGLTGIVKYPINVGLEGRFRGPSGISSFNADILPEHDMYMWNIIL